MPSCPRFGAEKFMRNGSVHDGKPKFSCEECRRQLVGNPSNEMIPQEAWSLAGRLLLEKISAAGIAGATETSEAWTQQYINRKHAPVPKRDEIWSFVGSKRSKSKAWIWIAIDRRSRKIAGIMREKCCVSFWLLGGI